MQIDPRLTYGEPIDVSTALPGTLLIETALPKRVTLFTEQVARKPNYYPWADDFIDAIWEGFWTDNEFSFASDFSQFKSDMTDQEREIIVRTLSAIGQIEIAVKTFWARLGDNLPHPAMQDLGYAMANNEVIHNKAYEKLLNRLGVTEVFEDNLKLPVIAGRVNYLRKYLQQVYGEDKRKQYIYAIILFTLFVENVSLFSQFYIVMWFNRYRNVLKDTAQQVQYTRNEEMLHAQVGIKIINTLREEHPELFDRDLENRIYEETLVAFSSESAVIDWIIGDYADDNISASLLKSYIAGRLNQSLSAIGYKPIFSVPEEALAKTYWMDEETLGNNMTDFFHKKPVEYGKHNKAYSDEDLF